MCIFLPASLTCLETVLIFETLFLRMFSHSSLYHTLGTKITFDLMKSNFLGFSHSLDCA